MVIPESQLDTWSYQGAGVGSRDTYAQVKSVLESWDAPYAGRDFAVFLQGSYGNDTNIRSESDVDIVIQLSSAFQHNASALPVLQKSAFHTAFTNSAGYSLKDFKQEVIAHLTKRYGNQIIVGDKAINIAANGNRRSADVIVSMNYRRYAHFNSLQDYSYTNGMLFKGGDGTNIINYPKLHSENCTRKHQNTGGWYKPTVRIFKNMRSRLIRDGLLPEGYAPSYYIEGMLWNAPNECFGTNYQNTVANILNWLMATDRSKLVCANKQYKLLYPDSSVTWRDEKCTAFLNAACTLWRQWQQP